MARISLLATLLLCAGVAASPVLAKPGPAMRQGSMAVNGVGKGNGQGSMAVNGTGPGNGEGSMAVNGAGSGNTQGSMAVNGTSPGHASLSRPGAAPPNWVRHAPHPASSARGG